MKPHTPRPPRAKPNSSEDNHSLRSKSSDKRQLTDYLDFENFEDLDDFSDLDGLDELEDFENLPELDDLESFANFAKAQQLSGGKWPPNLPRTPKHVDEWQSSPNWLAPPQPPASSSSQHHSASPMPFPEAALPDQVPTEPASDESAPPTETAPADGHSAETASHSEENSPPGVNLAPNDQLSQRSHDLPSTMATHTSDGALNLTDQEITSSQQPLLNLHDISVNLSCQVGNVELSLAELSQLKQGSCIELIRWPSKVKLLFNNLTFAEGILVEINGKLGVKITNKYNGVELVNQGH